MYRVNQQKCTGCRICLQSCPGATKIGADGKAEVIDQEKLAACGGEKVCPFGAIEKVDEENGSKDNNSNNKEVSENRSGYGMGRGRGLGLGRGMGRGQGRGLGRGLGLGRGRGWNR